MYATGALQTRYSTIQRGANHLAFVLMFALHYTVKVRPVPLFHKDKALLRWSKQRFETTVSLFLITANRNSYHSHQTNDRCSPLAKRIAGIEKGYEPTQSNRQVSHHYVQ